ncbi:MAG: YidC/Oxa1 family membrane protein insertase [Clostridia bacterium]|nr:YidC/Oxa1 family membrane protein insertase [Clostridia bacterium]
MKYLGIVISFFNTITSNYLFAVILFALAIKLLLLPFGIKQQKNMISQAKLAPKEMAIRKKYAGRDDMATKQKIQQEIQELYQREGYKPATGCLMLLIQLPIMLLLYNVIMRPLEYISGFSSSLVSSITTFLGDAATNASRSINLVGPLRNAIENSGGVVHVMADGTMHDIVASDLPNFNLLGIDLSEIPGYRWTWYLLIPVLVFASTWLTSWLTRKFSYQSPIQNVNQNPTMKFMNVLMPLLSAFISISLPALVAVYWVANSIFSLVQQIILTKLMPFPKYTEEDYKNAEREMRANIRDAKRIEKQNSKRSLHFADDEEDYDSIQITRRDSEYDGGSESKAETESAADGEAAEAKALESAGIKGNNPPPKKKKK